MDSNIVKRVVEALANKADAPEPSMPYFSDQRYRPLKIDNANFKPIKEIKQEHKVCFVDGGNAEIIKSSNFSLHFVRAYYGTYNGAKKESSSKEEAYILVYASKDSSAIKYKAEIFGSSLIDANGLSIELHDKSMAEGYHEVSISKIGELARRFMELKIAEKAIDSLNKGDVVVLDGTLQCCLTNESSYLNSLYSKAMAKGVIISALAKTFNFFADNGMPLSKALAKIAPKEPWFYYPVAEISSPDHLAELLIAKFHEKSRHIFRLEAYKENKPNIDKLAALLRSYCNDPVFLGYPYGLIEADRNARVSNKEKAYLTALLMTRAGKSWKTIEEFLATADAHGILDSVS